MPIQFKDFVPRKVAEAGLFKPAEFESFDEAVKAASRWVKENDVQLINVETVLLPNIWSHFENGTADSSLGTSGDSPSHWHQFVRCWYRVG